MLFTNKPKNFEQKETRSFIIVWNWPAQIDPKWIKKQAKTLLVDSPRATIRCPKLVGVTSNKDWYETNAIQTAFMGAKSMILKKETLVRVLAFLPDFKQRTFPCVH